MNKVVTFVLIYKIVHLYKNTKLVINVTIFNKRQLVTFYIKI